MAWAWMDALENQPLGGNMTDPRPCRISCKTGKSSLSIAEFIQQEKLEGLQLAWAEPDPHFLPSSNLPGRCSAFHPLVRGVPSWPAELPLLEARLFWDETALHIVATDKGCKWVRVEEELLELPETQKISVTRHEFPVVTLSDPARFGLDIEPSISKMCAIEYRQQGRLVSWRLRTVG